MTIRKFRRIEIFSYAFFELQLIRYLYWFSTYMNVKYFYIYSLFTHCTIRCFHRLLNLKTFTFRCIVVRFHHTYAFIFLQLYINRHQWHFWEGFFLYETLKCKFFLCFMNHKSVFVNSKKYEPEDWKYFSSSYPVVRILTKYIRASKHLNSVWIAYRCICIALFFFLFFCK